jgi:hypothetical protein
VWEGVIVLAAIAVWVVARYFGVLPNSVVKDVDGKCIVEIDLCKKEESLFEEVKGGRSKGFWSKKKKKKPHVDASIAHQVCVGCPASATGCERERGCGSPGGGKVPQVDAPQKVMVAVLAEHASQAVLEPITNQAAVIDEEENVETESTDVESDFSSAQKVQEATSDGCTLNQHVIPADDSLLGDICTGVRACEGLSNELLEKSGQSEEDAQATVPSPLSTASTALMLAPPGLCDDCGINSEILSKIGPPPGLPWTSATASHLDPTCVERSHSSDFVAPLAMAMSCDSQQMDVLKSVTRAKIDALKELRSSKEEYRASLLDEVRTVRRDIEALNSTLKAEISFLESL